MLWKLQRKQQNRQVAELGSSWETKDGKREKVNISQLRLRKKTGPEMEIC